MNRYLRFSKEYLPPLKYHKEKIKIKMLVIEMKFFRLLKTMNRYLRFSKEYLPPLKTMNRYLRLSKEYLPPLKDQKEKIQIKIKKKTSSQASNLR